MIFANTKYLHRVKPVCKRKDRDEQKGFTLLELLIVIALLTITVGVTGDIILSLVRSYSKTRVTNEVEQTGNLAMSKIEKEFRAALSVSSPALGDTGDELSFIRVIDGVEHTITYTVEVTGGLLRREDINGTNISTAAIIDGEESAIKNPDTAFSLVQENPYVVKINFELRQGDSTLPETSPIASKIDLETTVVARGSYR